MHIYIHIPFCRKKCRYCAFYSVPAPPQDEYLHALTTELKARASTSGFFHSPQNTLYIGGGTPSLLTPAQFSELVETVKKFYSDHFDEFTVEANPESFTPTLAEHLKKLGVNRISIGVQSLRESHLKYLGRIHSSQQAIDAIKTASRNFPRVSADLIYGIPGQKVEEILEDIETLIELGAKHISLYALTPEEETPLWLERFSLPDEDVLAEQYHKITEFLQELDFIPYEVSNFALPGHFSRHNIAYWEHKPYMGFGASAHSFDGTRRWANISNQKRYSEFWNSNPDAFHGNNLCDAQKIPLDFCERLNENQIVIERVMLGLRTMWGVRIAELGAYSDKILNEAEKLITHNILNFDGERLWLNPDKRFLADRIALELTRAI